MERRDSSNGATVSTTHMGDVESSRGAEYEVFLNFRGPDTRLNFTDCLYHTMDGAGIHVFRDDDEIRKGEAIGGELQRVIKSSRICMPIFSRNYASSTWCLRELAYMVECSKNKNDKAMILPVFFDVDPDDVKLKTGLYHDALQKHEQKFGYDEVQRWKEALREVAHVKGWDLKGGGQGELIRLIVAEVLIKLNKREKHLPDHLVGIQDHVEEVVRLLDEGSLDVRYLVIHGMGGIGKTTLAKVVFNQISSQFQGCSFLLDVCEALNGGKVVQLQKQLLSEILNFKPVEISDSDAGINQIKRRFRDKKVIIVLDNLNKWDQLSAFAEKSDWFGLGSRIIITTRDTNFLPIKDEIQENNVQMHFEEFKIYQMRELHYHHSLQLFSKHAFKMDSPPHDYYDISCNIIHKASGLPLALEVIGSSLYCKSKKLWKDTLRKLALSPNQDVLHKLKLSFDMLEDAQREIFLDIACYFIGEERINPYYMWKALDFFPRSNIIVLNRMSLIKIVDDKLVMHDLLRDLGREIIRQEDPKAPGKRSRLWCSKIALDVVQARKGTENIIALKLTGLSKEYDFTGEKFSRLPNLSFLELEGGNLVGDFKNLLSSLRWFSWRRCPTDLQAVNLCLSNLIVLKLSDSDIPESWNGWGPCLANSDLKVIHLTRCHLSTTPDFSTCLNLKILVLNGHCPKSFQTSGSICKLKRLKRLEIIAAQVQQSQLSASLHFNLFALLSAMCCLKYLSTLKLEGQCIEEVHASIGEMVGLTCLSLRGCYRLRKLPSSIGKLRLLLVLNLFNTGITEVPDTIGDLKRLKKIDLEFSQVTKLPNSIGGLESLLYLYLQGSRIKELPDSVRDLKRLQEITLDYTQAGDLVNSLGGLESLVRLYLQGAKIRKLPASTGYLKRLEMEIREPPKEIGMPENNELLEYNGCRNITWMEECNPSFDITSPPQLWSLSISCDDPQSLRRLPFNLCLLELRDVKSPIEQPFFSNLRYLRYLSELTLFRCWLREIQFEQLENLHRLDIAECELLVMLSGLSSLGKLKVLTVWSCSQLTEIQELVELETLEALFISKCSSIKWLPDLSKLRKLWTFSLFHCESVQRLPNVPNRCHAYVHGCPMLGESGADYKFCEQCTRT